MTWDAFNQRVRASFPAHAGALTVEKLLHPEDQHLHEPKTVAGVSVCARESLNTPLSPLKPWPNGRFRFPSVGEAVRRRAPELTSDQFRGVIACPA